MLEVAALAARPDGSPPVAAITSGRSRARPAASSGSRSELPSAQRYSIVALRPTANPPPPSPLRNPPTYCAEGPGEALLRKPIVRIAGGCWARAARGQTADVAAPA